MARYWAWAALIAVAAGAAGCGPGKELPDVIVPPGDSAAQQQAVPPRSDAEAKAAADRAVKAFTADRPELMAKVTASRCALKGQMFSVDSPNQWTEAAQSVAAVWPDRVHGVNERHPQGNKLVTESWLHRPDVTVHSNGQPVPLSDVGAWEHNIACDAVGQNWMPLLLPITDPKAVVFDLQAVTVGARGLTVLKVALADYPIYQLTFDAKSGALVRVEYTTSMGNVPRRTTVVFSDHKPGPDGLVLPHQIECRHNGSAVEKWTVEKWEFPATIPDDEFSPPKGK